VTSAEPSGPGVDLRLAEGADVSQIMSQVAARVGMRRIELRRPNLEDIFIQIVGGDAAALRAELDRDGAAERSFSPQGVES
jgi:hypothetical protein